MSDWRTLADGRKVFVEGAEPSSCNRAISSEFLNPEKRLSHYAITRTEQGKLGLTKCFWCGSSVYFVENIYGGCFLADSIPSGGGWVVHPCWHKHSESSLENAVSYYCNNKIKPKKLLKLVGTIVTKTVKVTKKGIYADNDIKIISNLKLRTKRKGTSIPFAAKLKRTDEYPLVKINNDVYEIIQLIEANIVTNVLVAQKSRRLGFECEVQVSLIFRKYRDHRIPFLKQVIDDRLYKYCYPREITRLESKSTATDR